MTALLRDRSVDLRFRTFVWLLAALVPAHFILWLRPILSAGGHLYGLGDDWAPGLRLPEPWQLICSQALLWAFAIPIALRRGRRAALALFFLAAAAHALWMPGAISNHWTLFLFALAACVALPFPRNGDPLLALRLLCILTYWFAFLHKLNVDYLRPETSAVRDFAHLILQNLPRIDEAMLWRRAGVFFIGASLAIEGGLPALLLCRRTRIAACVAGLAFHGCIALCQHGEYSQLMVSFYVLFFDESDWAALLSSLRRISPSRAAAAICIAFLSLRVSYLEPWIGSAKWDPPGIALRAEWLTVFAIVASFSYLALFLAGAKQAPPEPVRAAPASKLAWAIAAAYALNCAGPYFSFQEHHAQAMFSSLDQLAWNHLFLPRARLSDHAEYVHSLEIDFGRPPDAALVAAHPALGDLLAQRGYVAANYLRAILAHACEEPLLLPIQVRYRDDAQVSVAADGCKDVRYSRFTFYPAFLPAR